MKKVRRKIRIMFHRHEAWAATTAIEFPLLSLFLTMSIFFLWAMVPVVIISTMVLSTYLLNEWLQEFAHSIPKTPIAILWMIIAIPLNLVLFLWIGRWYLISASLMLGSEKSAHKKLAETQAKLKALTDA